jgi:hypothetical protein
LLAVGVVLLRAVWRIPKVVVVVALAAIATQ